eukprot:SAG31_NODE_1040_length_10203_cov_3.045428_7_plen_352_part_00
MPVYILHAGLHLDRGHMFTHVLVWAVVSLVCMKTCSTMHSTASLLSAPIDPMVTLPGNVAMPVVALGTAGYDNATAEAAVKLALKTGLTHIHTAFDYFNQPGVGAGLAGQPRHTFFVTTMTSPCIHTASSPYRNITDPAACHALTKADVAADLENLNLDFVDLLLLHGPAQNYGTRGVCKPDICDLTRAQWAAYVELFRAGKARAIGVSNFCPSCFDCLATSNRKTVWPAVNQIQYHVGMGKDPEGLLSYSKARGIVVQAYSPLASGRLLQSPPRPLIAIAQARNKSIAQVALKWILQADTATMALVTKADKQAYIAEDLSLFHWELTDDEMSTLNAITKPSNVPSWGCTQ